MLDEEILCAIKSNGSHQRNKVVAARQLYSLQCSVLWMQINRFDGFFFYYDYAFAREMFAEEKTITM